MRLPFAERAQVEERKVLLYLLAEDHPAGGSKALFFRNEGYTSDNWKELAERLLAHGRDGELVEVRLRPGGSNCCVRGPWQRKRGDVTTICTVWFLAEGSEAPRLVTAYPD